MQAVVADANAGSDDNTPYWIDLDVGAVPGEGKLDFGEVTFYRRKSPDGLIPEIFDPGDGGPKAIRLAVQAGRYLGPLADPGDCCNDRCELRGPVQRMGVDVWQGFSIRVPSDFPVKPLRCVVAQMKMPYDTGGDGSPAFALRIDSGRWLVTVEHLYEVCDKTSGRYLSALGGGTCTNAVPAYDHSNFNKHVTVTDYQVRAFVAAEASGLPAHVVEQELTNCTTGVRLEASKPLPPLQLGGGWTDFIIHVSVSGVKNRDGVIELYADNDLIFRASGEFGYPDQETPPKQYFKVGPYRNNDVDWGKEAATLEYRHLRRGRTMEDVTLARMPHTAVV